MPDISKEELVDLRVSKILEHAEERIFEQFDDLHKRGINDDDIILYLRKQGDRGLAERYIEWSGALDPEREANETLGGAVPDPASAPSYTGHPLNKPAKVEWP